MAELKLSTEKKAWHIGSVQLQISNNNTGTYLLAGFSDKIIKNIKTYILTKKYFDATLIGLGVDIQLTHCFFNNLDFDPDGQVELIYSLREEIT